MKAFLAAVAFATPLLIGAQQQTSKPRGDWPCGARVDTSYFQIAEGSGGHLLLLAPEEISDSATLLTAFGSHQQTIFRLAGSLTPGSHEFHVPVDSSVESLLFSVSVQCLQVADVVRPSGAPASGDDVTDLSNFRAERMVIVKRPGAGIWTVLVSGSGVAGVVVQARSPIGIAQVQFATSQNGAFTAVPSTGVENLVRIRISGRATEIHGSLVNGGFRTVAQLPLEAADDGSYVSRFTPGQEGFRVVIAGKDSEGVPFQRVHAPLITPMR